MIFNFSTTPSLLINFEYMCEVGWVVMEFLHWVVAEATEEMYTLWQAKIHP